MSLQQNVWKEEYNWEIVSTALQLVFTPVLQGEITLKARKLRLQSVGEILLGVSGEGCFSCDQL